jgi:hypothetical protein
MSPGFGRINLGGVPLGDWKTWRGGTGSDPGEKRWAESKTVIGPWIRPTRRRVSLRAKTSRFGIAVSMVNVRRAAKGVSSEDPPDTNAARKSDSVEKMRAFGVQL